MGSPYSVDFWPGPWITGTDDIGGWSALKKVTYISEGFKKGTIWPPFLRGAWRALVLLNLQQSCGVYSLVPVQNLGLFQSADNLYF